jgi:hypothetical protein
MGAFVGGVLCTLSAWVIGSQSFVARVRAVQVFQHLFGSLFYGTIKS